jgi:preprotein translocase subunit SecG
VLAMGDAIVVIVVVVVVIVVVVVVGTKSGIGFFAKFEVSTNVGKIREMLDRERSGR